MKILALHLNNFLEYAQLRGLSREEMIRLIKNPPSDLQGENATVEVLDFYSVVRFIMLSLKDELLGLRLGNLMNLKALGLIYQISLQATTIEEALFYLKSYLNSTFPIIDIQTEVNKTYASIILKIDNEYHAENVIILENVLFIIGRELKIMAGNELSLNLYSPCYQSKYPLEWNKGNSFSLTFENRVLKANFKNRIEWNLDILVPGYLKMIEELRQEKSFTTKVKIAILSMAKPDLPNLELVAEAFNITPRTFQRRLDSENTTFRVIISEIKRKISYLLIGHKRFSVTEISDILGFSEPASFIHTFKKWYGNSPERFRQQINR
ncbi:MAG TPA: helix-turn-helix domain-containing protein [Cytophagales bacterium]|nr:helix-turn-helix domain-containing protein [Cytophagales bacterium]